MSISISIDNEEGQIEVRTPGTVSPVIEEGLIEETKNTAANNCTVCLRYSWTIAQIIGFMLVCVWIAFMATLVPQSMDTIHNFITRMIGSHEWITLRHPYAPHPMSEVIIDCTINSTNIASNFELFMLLHFVRYFVCAFIVRNRPILWSLSILYEVFELILTSVDAFKMPFRECWWNSVFFDIFFMNALGIELGLFAIKQINKLIPDAIIFYDGFSNIKQWNAPRCVPVIAIILFYVIFMSQALNPWFIFFTAFWMDPVNVLCIFRETCFALTGLFSVSQLYHALCLGRRKKSIWSIHWLVIVQVLIALEFIIICKAYSAQ
eukprot:476392_1